MLNLRLARPQYIVDLNRIPGLDYIAERDGALAVGALTRQRSLERSPSVRQRLSPAVRGHHTHRP